MAVGTKENLPNRIEVFKSRFKTLQIPNKPLKMLKTFKWNFDKSSHSDSKPTILYREVGLLLNSRPVFYVM